MIISGCSFYSNSISGIDGNSSSLNSPYLIENCTFIANGVNGINSSGGATRYGQINNCAFGTGTMTNVSGSIGLNVSSQTNSLFLLTSNTTPWIDPANGDFRINSSDVKSLGRGSFTQTASSYAGTIAYPDIGAAQSASTNATTRAFGFSQ